MQYIIKKNRREVFKKNGLKIQRVSDNSLERPIIKLIFNDQSS